MTQEVDRFCRDRPTDLCLSYIGFSLDLRANVDVVIARLAALPPVERYLVPSIAVPPPPARPKPPVGPDRFKRPDLLERLAKVLAPKINLGEMIATPAAEARAVRLRLRLDEIEDKLGARPPVYVFLTKLDLMPGFVDCFGLLEGGEREQAWGMSFAYDDLGGKPAIDGFGEQLLGLVKTLRDRVGDLVLRAQKPDRAARLHTLPAQIAYRLPIIDTFMRTIFGHDREGRCLLLRGVYLTSATADSLAIDNLAIDELQSNMSRRFGFSGTSGLPPNLDLEVAAQGFFLAQPMREVVLAESGLIVRGRASYRHRHGMIVIFGLIFAALGGLSLSIIDAP